MSSRALHVVVPGDLETKTGGYGYDREIIAGLRRRGWQVVVVPVSLTYPVPTDAERASVARALASIPAHGCVLVDGLAFGVLPAEMANASARLRLVALVHHPLGLETGLEPDVVSRLLESERASLAHASGVVVTSPRTISAVEALAVSPEQIVVVEPGTATAPVATGSGGGTRQLLTVASLVPRKGYDTLFDALERLTNVPWHLTCVGSLARDHGCAEALVQRAAVLPLAGRITMAGELAGAALDAAYHAADIFVLPTHYEGYGMVVAEALARGLPVVSTDTGAIGELVGREAGVLVPAGDAVQLAVALEALLADDSALARLRSGALRVRASLPTWDAACARMEGALVRFGCL